MALPHTPQSLLVSHTALCVCVNTEEPHGLQQCHSGIMLLSPGQSPAPCVSSDTFTSKGFNFHSCRAWPGEREPDPAGESCGPVPKGAVCLPSLGLCVYKYCQGRGDGVGFEGGDTPVLGTGTTACNHSPRFVLISSTARGSV